MMRPRGTLLLGLVLLLSPLASRAFAQTAQWIVVPVGVTRAANAERGGELMLRALADRRVPALSLHETRDRLLARSHRAPEATDAQRKALARAKERAIEHAAFGRNAPARKLVEDTLASVEPSLESLERDTPVARDILDLCLTLVRVELQTGNRAQAVESAKRCRQIVPDLAPSENTHAANVIGALAEAENQLRRSGAAPLVIESADDERCAVLVFGRRMGTAPYRFEGAPEGPARVELECGELRSRVHVVNLGPKPITLRIDARHDARIREQGLISLAYDDEADLEAHLVGDAIELANTIGAKQIVLARDEGEAVTFVRYDLSRSRAVAVARVPTSALADPAAASWREAAEALVLEREQAPMPTAFTTPPPREPPRPSAATAPVAPQVGGNAASTDAAGTTSEPSHTAPGAPEAAPAPATPPSPSRRKSVLIAGGVLAGLGAGLLATGYGLYARSQTLEDRAAEGMPGTATQLALQQDYEDARNLPYIGLGGAALLATATPLLLPKHGPRSALAWVGGALAGLAGAGLIAWGAATAGDDAPLGSLLMASGVPLLEIPITQGVRAARD